MGSENKKRHKQKEKSRKLKPQPKNPQNSPSTDFEINPDISIIGISVKLDPHGIGLSKDTKYIIDNDDKDIIKIVPQEYMDKFHAIANPFNFAGQIKKNANSKNAIVSWPQNWFYLSENQRKKLEGLGIINTQNFMMNIICLHFQDNLGIYIYPKTNIEGLLDTYIEIAWIDYVIQHQLREYEKMYTHKSKRITLDKINFQFNVKVAQSWLTLENCVIRIDAIWDRIVEFLVPLYFFGNILAKLYTTNDIKKRLASDIKKIINPIQLDYFNLLLNAAMDYEKSEFKKLRNRVIHEFVNRPEGSVPTGDNTLPTPQSIEELHAQVVEQLSKVREALLIFIGVMIHKTPQNKQHEGNNELGAEK